MYERFTDRARKTMQLANQEAQRLNHELVGTEHILLGLIKEGSGIAATVLKTMGVNLNAARAEAEQVSPPGPEMVTMGKLPQTPRASKVIQAAIEESRSLKHNYIGTEHILLGLLREPEGPAAQVLASLGLKFDAVRDEVLSLVTMPNARQEDYDKAIGEYFSYRIRFHEQIPLQASQDFKVSIQSEPMPESKILSERRCKYFAIARQTLTEVFKGRVVLSGETLPPDAIIGDVVFDGFNRCLSVPIYSATYEPVIDGARPPYADGGLLGLRMEVLPRELVDVWNKASAAEREQILAAAREIQDNPPVMLMSGGRTWDFLGMVDAEKLRDEAGLSPPKPPAESEPTPNPDSAPEPIDGVSTEPPESVDAPLSSWRDNPPML